MKKIFVLLWVLVMALCLTGCGSVNLETAKKGDIVEFGNYAGAPIKWRCLAVEGKKKLLITEHGIDCKMYHDNGDEFITWEMCSLRKWLNGEFYKKAFADGERSKILVVENSNVMTFKHGSHGGNNTLDRVFCLSKPEVEKYLPDRKERKCSPTSLAVQNGIEKNEEGCAWWLRSTTSTDCYNIESEKSINDAIVSCGGGLQISAYSILPDGNYNVTFLCNKRAVRPAMWVKSE